MPPRPLRSVATSVPEQDPDPVPPVLRVTGRLEPGVVGSVRSAAVTLPGEDRLILDLTEVSTVERRGLLTFLRALHLLRGQGHLVAVVTRNQTLIRALTRDPERPALVAGSLDSARARLDRAGRAA